MVPSRTPTPRGRAQDSRTAILAAAIHEFAGHGYHGATTDRIAKQVGLTQPYIFKLFGSKKDLFIAALHAVYTHVHATFEQAARQDASDKLRALGVAYVPLLRTRDEFLMMLHAFTATDDPDIARVVRERYAGLFAFVRDVSGASEADVRAFFAEGTLLMVAASVHLPDLVDPEIRPVLFSDPGDEEPGRFPG